MKVLPSKEMILPTAVVCLGVILLVGYIQKKRAGAVASK